MVCDLRDWVKQLEGFDRFAGLGEGDREVGGVANQAWIGRAGTCVSPRLEALFK